MSATKHCAELCTLLVHDIYGELPSRIYAALCTKGKVPLAILGQATALNPRHLKHGLAVLIQHNLIYHQTHPTTGLTTYSANIDACYNLLRVGRIIEQVGRQYGAAEREVLENLVVLGHAQVADLVQAFVVRPGRENGTSLPTSEETEVKTETETQSKPNKAKRLVTSTYHLHEVLSRLIQAEILDVVEPETFRNPDDVYDEIELKYRRLEQNPSRVRQKVDYHRPMMKEFRDARDRPKSLKRQLDMNMIPTVKRRKLMNGESESAAFTKEEEEEEDAAVHGGGEEIAYYRRLDARTIVRINYEKCLVDLRNEKLVQWASDALSDITAAVYRSVLQLVTKHISRCRLHQRIDYAAVDDDDPSKQVHVVSTIDILSHYHGPLGGIGRTDPAKIHIPSAEKIQPLPIQDEDQNIGPVEENGNAPAEDTLGAGAVSESDDDGENGTADLNSIPEAPRPVNGTSTKEGVKDKEGARGKEGGGKGKEGDSRMDQLRQHLLLLSESRLGLLRHCGSASYGEWTVDFDVIMKRLRQQELDAIIQRSCGRHGIRLARILRDHGKLDEKSLASLALMKKQTVQQKILELQTAGFVDVQEVPRDNSRVANRTMFFWYSDPQASQKVVLENSYKIMLRCLQRLEVERYRERELLAFVDRTDVQGQEQDVMSAEHYQRYRHFLALQEKLLTEIMRMDDLAAMFRDY